jgi:hypothetical protein
MNLLVSTLVAVIVTAAAGAQSAPAISSAEARKAIEAVYVVFGKAAVAPMDKNTMERMLAPDLYVQTASRRATRQEYLDYLYTRYCSEAPRFASGKWPVSETPPFT